MKNGWMNGGTGRWIGVCVCDSAETHMLLFLSSYEQRGSVKLCVNDNTNSNLRRIYDLGE